MTPPPVPLFLGLACFSLSLSLCVCTPPQTHKDTTHTHKHVHLAQKQNDENVEKAEQEIELMHAELSKAVNMEKQVRERFERGASVPLVFLFRAWHLPVSLP